jgi:hypothetical protein
MRNIEEIRRLIREYLLEGLLDEKSFSTLSTTTTDKVKPVSYSIKGVGDTELDVVESPQQRAKRFNLRYSKLINKLTDEDLEIISGLLYELQKNGTLNIKYSRDWHKYNFYPYLIELIAHEAKEGNERAKILIEKIFDPSKSEEIRASLVGVYNKYRKPDSSGNLVGFIQDINSEDVLKVVNRMSNYRYVLKSILDKYNGDDNFLPFVLNRLQLRFSSGYNQLEQGKKNAPKKMAGVRTSYGNSVAVSDIQKYLYQGNNKDEINNNFIQFNNANKEIINYFNANKMNPKYTAIVDGVFNSKLDTEEMIEVYPQFFNTKTNVSNVFLHLVKNEKLANYINGVYKSHGLELPDVSTWSMKDISSSQDVEKKLKKDDFGGMFESLRRIMNIK